MSRFYLPFTHLRHELKLSERAVTLSSGLSRGAVRQLEDPSKGNVTMNSINQLAALFERDVEVIVGSQEILSDYSTVAIAMKIARDGFDSWKIHLFDFVDEFRRTADARLLILPPPSSTEIKIAALIQSTVHALCEEVSIDTPRWAIRRRFLPEPWFIAQMHSLKASAILESPISFRANNIFVLENFLTRV
jgi:hypothetical protein